MKARKLLMMAVSGALLLSLGSCLKDQADLFEQPSSARLNSYLQGVSDQLSSAPYGWELEYYPGTAYAGVTFILDFTDQKVTAVCETNLKKEATSTYVLTNDVGAAISFDTYNEVLHYYATPSASKYQARGGDFEFQIIGVEDGLITLRGKRSRNVCYLRRLTKSGMDHLRAIQEMDKKLSVAAVAATITGGLVEAYLEPAKRLFSIGRKGAADDEMTDVRYILTETGIKFAEPFTFQGVTFSELTFDADAETLTGSDIVFEKTLPTGWVSYEDYLGDYTLTYGSQGKNFKVALTQDEPGLTFHLTGLFPGQPEASVSVGYSGGRGRLTIVRQVVGAWGSKSMLFAPWDSTEGYYTWTENVGVYGYVEDATVQNFKVLFADNGVWERYAVNAWLIVPFDGTEPTDDDTPSSWYFATGSEQLPGDITLTKIAQ